MSDNTDASVPIESDVEDPDSDDDAHDGEEDALTPDLDADELPVTVGGP